MPLNATVTSFFEAPYLTVHRGDLHNVLMEAVRANPDIVLRLGYGVEEFAVHANGITVEARSEFESADERGIALIAADGLWSALRARLGHREQPRFAGRTAWRAAIPAERVAAQMREPVLSLWLGRHAHLVHYPVSAGTLINIVAIFRDDWQETGWSAHGSRDDVIARFSRWAPLARDLIATPESWLKWSLFDLPPLDRWGEGAVTLLGDAAHPMLPFLAQGAAAAIEDAYVLAQCMQANPDEPAMALRRYESLRMPRTQLLQRTSARNGRAYARWGVSGFLRNAALRAMGGRGLMQRYSWVYNWRSDLPAFS
jgi:salicylate hydroxylase